ncbi:MAG: DEAD/DEAH box helicase [Bacteroidales bacterium]|nr:DEAD/DEAH box helicase [Bacteroidales bacterium]
MDTFNETGLNQEILAAVSDLGFTTPTSVQQKAIPHLMNSTDDLIACAQTGTGKTAAFGLPLLHHTDIHSNKIQSIILCPTRELCLQITKDIESYAKHLKGFRVIPVYGGASIDTQINALNKGGQFVVGTPGRTLDLIKRKRLRLGNVRWLVLDEADEMLSMGFKDDLDAILSTIPDNKQTLLFSATMPNEIVGMAKTYMKNPVEISVGSKNVSTENVSHAYYVAQAKDRYIALKRIVDMHPNIYAIIFCRTRRETKEVADKLSNDGYNSDALHGDLSQAQRDHVMSRFRNKQLQLLVATDVAARGLDVHDLSHIINYNLPDETDIYTHRSGRTGRAEKKGVSLSIVHTREMNKISMIEKKIGKKMERKMIPLGKDICKKQLFKLIDTVEKVEVNESQIEAFMPSIYQKLEWLDRENLVKHFVSVEFNRFLSYYEDAPDINVNIKKSDFKSTRNEKQGKNKTIFTRFFINIGSKNKLTPKLLLTIINQNINERNAEVGKIEILKSFSFFETDEAYKSLILKSFKNVEYEGIKLLVEESNKKKQDSGRDDNRGRDYNRGRDKNRGREDNKETRFKRARVKRSKF